MHPWKALLLFLHALLLSFMQLLGSKAAAMKPSLRNESDRLALLAFRDGISDDPLQVLKSWNSSLHFCEWNGITCSRRHQQRVVALELTGSGLVGHISPFIANLTFLRTCSLSNNSFNGEIPQEMCFLFRLQYLNLSSNSFSGKIPAHLGNCSELRNIDFDTNRDLGGEIPVELGSLSKLINLDLSRNNFTGNIPSSLGNLSSLVTLILSGNDFTGGIPHELGLLQSLQRLQLGGNELSGVIPPSIYNLSSLVLFTVCFNRMRGTLLPNIGVALPRLQYLFAGGNEFTGHIPVSLSNASGLQLISIPANNLSGGVPTNLGSLVNLWELNVGGNRLGSQVGNNDLDFLNSLTNCSKLTKLGFGGNKFRGMLPSSIANLSIHLTDLWLGKNQIFGIIPEGLENLINLVDLRMNLNQFVGPIPLGIMKLKNLQFLGLSTNELSGQIPVSLCNITHILELYLCRNNFQGSIPTCLGNFQQIEKFSISENNLIGAIPKQIFNTSSWFLNFSSNSLTGPLPSEVGNMKNLVQLYVSKNKMSGEIPIMLGKCRSLVFLFMDNNFFQGAIPSSFSNLGGLSAMDLSHNNLSNHVPKFLEKFPSLEYLNLSFNNLEGELPKDGIFKNASAVSIQGNKNLCGGIPMFQLPACASQTSKNRNTSRLKIIIAATCTSLLLILLSCAFAILLCIRSSRKKSSSTSFMEGQLLKVSYRDLLKATDGFSLDNLVGAGTYGSIFKGVLDRVETAIAVKVLNQHQQGALKSFIAECEALRNIRHRNLVKILTTCSSIDYHGNDFKALVFEFIPNGNLEMWLHPSINEQHYINEQHQLRGLSLVERLNIAIDVASAVEYLHHHGQTPLVHHDLKPSNVLLDNEMTAHVGDFGLAKFLIETTSISFQSQTSSTSIKGTVGYVAPEYGLGGKSSIQGDVYSYGILLLEMFTGKRPTDDMFKNGLGLHQFAKMALDEHVVEIIDSQLQFNDDNRAESSRIQESLVSIFHIGVACSIESPNDRMDMRDVAAKLKVIRDKFLGVGIYKAR